MLNLTWISLATFWRAAKNEFFLSFSKLAGTIYKYVEYHSIITRRPYLSSRNKEVMVVDNWTYMWRGDPCLCRFNFWRSVNLSEKINHAELDLHQLGNFCSVRRHKLRFISFSKLIATFFNSAESHIHAFK